MICYHHNDMDGKSAAYVVHKFKPEGIEDHPTNYYMVSYDDILDKHTSNDDVFIVDLSINKSTYNMLLEVCKTARSVTWIDHHASSIDIVEAHKEELQKISNLTYFVSNCACGAALTYAYMNIPRNELFDIRKISDEEEYSINAEYKDGGTIKVTTLKSNKNNKTDSTWYTYDIILPLWLFHIDDYDCWKKISPNTDTFILGTDACNTSLTIHDRSTEQRIFNPFWDSISNDIKFMNKYISNGRIISKYIHSRYYKELRNTFEWTYNGITFLCKNGNGNSWNFESLIEKYPAVILFYYSGKVGKWLYSVYSDKNSKFNCKEFCEKFGGGGHPHASGFSTKELIFTSSKYKNIKTNNIIFLGGTCNESSWREKFISYWKNNKSDNIENIRLFNPVAEDLTEECRKREDEIKKNAKLNLFVITKEMTGAYSFVEATECSHNSKVFLAIYDDSNFFTQSQIKSFNAIGSIIEKNGGVYKVYRNNINNGYDKIHDIVNDVIASI